MDKYGTGQDPYCYPGTDVLRNKLNIDEAATLEEAERDLSMINAASIELEPPPFDLAYLQRLHSRLFDDLYDWAGELRSIDIAKGDTRFCHVPFIAPESEKLFRKLAAQAYFTQLDKSALVAACAELYGDLNAIHPFREGNGRTQRLFFEHLIINCGYRISWAGIERATWIKANIAAMACEYEALAAIFESCIGPPLQD
ncbi:putative adenosine monophosphate-protein transferase Fic [Halomonas sp. PAMB 3264]|uniref:putative adenosine monophosphate-protein transferase Fic n=1 Tax=Halomonas sp. PAMB 3264 TaxID=3075222 RepID=UPI00289F4B6C|nr:putative adenosine monophosphate-protein transferase Fic [Halomonas sp. PAMB 3264]WNL43241.1 putative adenosine monophosphate-protein transferase Fic [Halomonas sp. PAMB 3264]